MNKIIYNLTLLLAVAAPCLLRAQSNNILDRARTELSFHAATRVELQSTYFEGKAEQGERTEATLHLQEGQFRLTYGVITAVFSRGVLTYHDASSNTLYISEPTEEELLQLNPLLFLSSGHKHYKISELPQTKLNHVLLFTPRSSSSQIKDIQVGFSRITGLPAEVIILSGENVSRLEVKIKKIDAVAKQAAEYFRLNKGMFAPGCEVVDLR